MVFKICIAIILSIIIGSICEKIQMNKLYACLLTFSSIYVALCVIDKMGLNF